jgi:hypothetical protein
MQFEPHSKHVHYEHQMVSASVHCEAHKYITWAKAQAPTAVQTVLHILEYTFMNLTT